MDKKEAIEFLRKSLSEIPHLVELPHDNRDYPLWHRVITGVLGKVFGNNSREYRDFVEAYPHASHLGENKQQKYREELKMRETAILSIIQVHEIVGVDTKPSTKPELPKAAKDYKIWQWIKSHKIPSIIITVITLGAAAITIYQFFFSK